MLLTKLTMVGGVRSVQELELLQCGDIKMALLEQDLSRLPENIQPMQLELQSLKTLITSVISPGLSASQPAKTVILGRPPQEHSMEPRAHAKSIKDASVHASFHDTRRAVSSVEAKTDPGRSSFVCAIRGRPEQTSTE